MPRRNPELTYPLSGVLPGMHDSFQFQFQDGANTNLPADVTIIVLPGMETVPPEALLTYPLTVPQVIPYIATSVIDIYYDLPI